MKYVYTLENTKQGKTQREDGRCTDLKKHKEMMA